MSDRMTGEQVAEQESKFWQLVDILQANPEKLDVKEVRADNFIAVMHKKARQILIENNIHPCMYIPSMLLVNKNMFYSDKVENLVIDRFFETLKNKKK